MIWGLDREGQRSVEGGVREWKTTGKKLEGDQMLNQMLQSLYEDIQSNIDRAFSHTQSQITDR